MHGLFADGSYWSKVIARLQAVGLNVTAVQNPLTNLEAAVASTQRALARQDGPTVLVGHSFAGMIITEAGVDPKVSAVVYVAGRAPDAGEDYSALANTFPAPPAAAGIVFDGDERHLGEAAFLHDFAGDLSEAEAKVLYAVQEPFNKALLLGRFPPDPSRSKPPGFILPCQPALAEKPPAWAHVHGPAPRERSAAELDARRAGPQSADG